jgi:ketosteroid isomerase-like protein
LRKTGLPAYLSGHGRYGVIAQAMEVTMRTTQAVLDNHLACFGAKDLEGILSDYADHAILFTPEGALQGPAEIRPLFERLLAEFGKPGASFSMKKMTVDGGYAYIIWSAETADNVYEFATDTFVVRNGKIAVQSFAGKITPRN